ncbi:hypothetical protein [Limnofasciculus baicalensis]|uniref:Uncharacterized protein n=1 Tax=Limnofasciculus baicalensis BBK-W-15 TaxID=2699891 RepID=A0AAE3GYH5_9CYAN|nr:hypothetical protein [Limnofasciculus baicalensis]MCP2732168.1 hypothetical protein [Limnofasciculus baicalensis BBK-W-15]
MKITSNIVETHGKLILLVVIALEVLLAAIYLAGIVLTGEAYPAFDMNGQMTVPSYFQAFHLFLIAAIAISILLFGLPSSRPPSRIFCCTVAVLFTYASVDEVFKIHLQLYNLLNTSHHRAWMPIYLGIGVSTLLIFHRDFIAMWHFHRKAISFVALGLGIFILGGFGGELFGVVLKPLLAYLFEEGDFIKLFLEKSRVAVEELSELIGESLIVYGLCLFLVRRLQKEVARI